MDTPSELVGSGPVAGFLPYDADTLTMQNGTHCSENNLFETRLG